MNKVVIFSALAVIIALPVRGQTGAAAGAAASAGGSQAGAGAQTTPSGVQTKGGAVPNAGLPASSPLPGREQLPGRDQLPGAPQNRPGAPGVGVSAGSNGITAGLGSSNQVGMSNQFGLGTNRFGSNRFGFGTNHFGLSNEFGFRTNRFGFTNRFGMASNDFRRSNGFGSNQFGLTNLAGTNRFAFTNEISISNSIEFSNQLGLVPGNVVPGVPVGGGGAAGVAPGPGAAAAAPGNPQPEPNLTLTGEAGSSNRLYSGIPVSANLQGIALQDRTVTENDRTLLLKLKQVVVRRLETMGAWGPAIHFWVQDGIVRIVGAVQTPELREQAEHLTQLIPGVAGIEDRLFVGNVDPNASDVDRELQFRLRETILPQVATKTSPIDFAVRNGVVTLVGSVGTSAEANQVATLVQQVAGVNQVKNEALVNPVNSSNSTLSATPELSPLETNAYLRPTGRTIEQSPTAPQPNARGVQPNNEPAPILPPPPQNDQGTTKP